MGADLSVFGDLRVEAFDHVVDSTVEGFEELEDYFVLCYGGPDHYELWRYRDPVG